MYTLVRSRYRLDRRAGRWAEANLSAAKITTLATNYGDVYLYCTYPGAQGVITKALRLSKIVDQLVNVEPSVTVQGWLTAQGNKTLPFEAKLPDEKVRLVKYAQAWHAGYNVQPQGRNLSAGSQVSKFAKEDLIVTHPNTSHMTAKLDTHCLWTVNGYFHLTDWGTDGLRIIDGNKTLRKSNDNQIGCYSFETIGAITKVPVTASMVKSQGPNAKLADAAYLTIPSNINLTNKTVLLVVGGYLQVDGKSYTRVGERTWRVSFGTMMWLDRYLESVRQMDLSSLGLTTDPANPSLLVLSEMDKDSTVKAYLNLSQTFFVIVNSPTFFQEYEPIESLKLPGRFVNPKDDQLPLVGAYGRMLDYHIIGEDQLNVYCGSNNVRHNFDANTRNWKTGTVIDGGRYPAAPYRHDSAFFRVLGVET